MRVLHVVESLEVGGMERVVQALCLSGSAIGMSCSVLCLRTRGPIADQLTSAGVQVDCLDLAGGPSNYFATLAVRTAVRRLGPDVVHTHNTDGLIFGVSGAWLAGVKTIVHTDHGRAFPDRWYRMLAERLAASMADVVVGVSEELTEALHRFLRIPREKLTTIPNGVIVGAPAESIARESTRRELRLSVSDVAFGTVSRLVWEKGLDVLIHAFARLSVDRPNAKLIIVGDGPKRKDLESLAATLGIESSVIFLGMRSDVGALLAAIDVYVLSSISEGLPMALLEAMSAGKPIIATRVGGMPDALGDGAGLLVNSKDDQSLFAAMRDLVSDAERRERLGTAAQARFGTRYTATQMSTAYSRWYGRRSPGIADSGR